MFRFITKMEYWDIEDSGITAEISGTPYWHLKDIQDAVAYNRLRHSKNQRIAEIGGGVSRILPVLAQQNYCVNIDKLEGIGNGPVGARSSPGIVYINAYLGNTKGYIEDAFFDIVFSISVVEHIDKEYLPAFFADNARIIRPEGLSFHLIDILCGDKEPSQWNIERNSITSQEFFKYFTPLSDQIIAPGDSKFSCSYATNPDNAMNEWNKIVPSAKEQFAASQSCTLFLAGKKINNHRF